MTTEQKLRLLEISKSVTALNKTLLEMAAEVEDAQESIPVLRSIDNLLKAATEINKAIQQ